MVNFLLNVRMYHLGYTRFLSATQLRMDVTDYLCYFRRDFPEPDSRQEVVGVHSC